MKIHRKYNTLEDFLISKPLNIDGELDDGWGAKFPIKGIEIEATILFCDISEFSRKTLKLNPIETLIFINNFFSWISAEALKNYPGIIDKYIGDEIMVIFSNEFGSNNHFIDAIQTARWMLENDAFSFQPHIGIASGSIVVGYVGTPLKYNCSAFGTVVAKAARCANIKSQRQDIIGGSIKFPAELWINYKFNKIFSNNEDRIWELLPKRTEKIKNMDSIDIMEIVKNSFFLPQQTAEQRAKELFFYLKEKGFYNKP